MIAWEGSNGICTEMVKIDEKGIIWHEIVLYCTIFEAKDNAVSWYNQGISRSLYRQGGRF